MVCSGRDILEPGKVDMAASSTITEGSRPLVYDAVNSHGSPELKQRAHGQRPVHLVFFLFAISLSHSALSNNKIVTTDSIAVSCRTSAANSLLAPVARSTNSCPLLLFPPSLC
jgi:hypothetical protein